MMHKRQRYVPTGHRDCCGDMVRRGDTVATRDGEGTVVWVAGKWWIIYPGLRLKALNGYRADGLRRVAERCDRGCDRACDSGVTVTCDRNPLSHILSHPLSQPKLVKIQRVNGKV